MMPYWLHAFARFACGASVGCWIAFSYANRTMDRMIRRLEWPEGQEADAVMDAIEADEQR